jgi:hypothetical protein
VSLRNIECSVSCRDVAVGAGLAGSVVVTAGVGLSVRPTVRLLQ